MVVATTNTSPTLPRVKDEVRRGGDSGSSAF